MWTSLTADTGSGCSSGRIPLPDAEAAEALTLPEGGKSGSTSDMIVTTMYTETGSLDDAGESGLWWWSYDDVCMAPIMEMKEDSSWDYILAKALVSVRI